MSSRFQEKERRRVVAASKEKAALLERKEAQEQEQDPDPDEDYYLKSHLCPISFQPFKDPVMAKDGHTYESEPFKQWTRKCMTSPATNLPLTSSVTQENFVVKQAVAEYAQDVIPRLKRLQRLEGTETELQKLRKKAISLNRKLEESHAQMQRDSEIKQTIAGHAQDTPPRLLRLDVLELGMDRLRNQKRALEDKLEESKKYLELREEESERKFMYQKVQLQALQRELQEAQRVSQSQLAKQRAEEHALLQNVRYYQDQVRRLQGELQEALAEKERAQKSLIETQRLEEHALQVFQRELQEALAEKELMQKNLVETQRMEEHAYGLFKVKNTEAVCQQVELERLRAVLAEAQLSRLALSQGPAFFANTQAPSRSVPGRPKVNSPTLFMDSKDHPPHEKQENVEPGFKARPVGGLPLQPAPSQNNTVNFHFSGPARQGSLHASLRRQAVQAQGSSRRSLSLPSRRVT